MSGVKRSCYSLGTSPKSEPSRVKRRIETPVSSLPQFIHENEGKDTGLACVTVCEENSTSSEERTTPADSDTTPFPLSPLSLGSNDSNSVDETLRAGAWDEKLTCFGTLLSGTVKLFQTLARPKKQIISTKCSVALTLRFRFDAVTLIHPSTSGEVGILDNKSALQLRRLKEIVPVLKVEAYLGQEEEHGTGYGVRGTTNMSVIPLQLNVYGPDRYFDDVGSFLSGVGMFLQEPVSIREGIASYRNPHFLSWDEMSKTPRLLGFHKATIGNFETEVEAILHSANDIAPSYNFEQDPRIVTILKGHQLSALQFMLAREDGEKGMFSLWEPTIINHRNGFIHKITREKHYQKPHGCRGGILADEMGLGKSLSLLALIMHTLNYARSSCPHSTDSRTREAQDIVSSGATLIVTPKSTLYSWEQELHRHISSDLKVHVYHGLRKGIDPNSLADQDIVFTTYETIVSDANRSLTLQAISWFRVVLDEAHHIRNRTQAFQAAMNLKTERRWCVTGTPVQNRISDLFTLTEFLRFYPVENRSNARRWILDPLGTKEEHALDNFRQLMKTIAIRRPKLSESNSNRSEREVQVYLSQAEREQYDSIRTKARETITRMGNCSSSHTLLSYILRMRQLCSHGWSGEPFHRGFDVLRKDLRSTPACDRCADSLTLSEINNLASDAVDGPRYCLECAFEEDISIGSATQSLSMPRITQQDLTTLMPRVSEKFESLAHVDERMDDRPKFADALTSSKIGSVLHNLFQLNRSLHSDKKPIKSLVFSCWTTTLDALAATLTRRGMQYTRIDGSLTLEQRRAAITRFHLEPDLKIMLLSFGSGSVGLNLTPATHVHIVEPQWNPMIEAQAAARVDRLDQDKDIVILRYIVKHSVEELIKARQRRKLWLAKLSTSYESTDGDANGPYGLNELESLVE